MFLNKLKTKISSLFLKKKNNFNECCGVLRRIYDNRTNTTKKGEKTQDRCIVLLGSKEEVIKRANIWEYDENEEKYITDCLLNWEFYTTLDAKERELIKKGALLRQKLMEECVRWKNR